MFFAFINYNVELTGETDDGDDQLDNAVYDKDVQSAGVALCFRE